MQCLNPCGFYLARLVFRYSLESIITRGEGDSQATKPQTTHAYMRFALYPGTDHWHNLSAIYAGCLFIDGPRRDMRYFMCSLGDTAPRCWRGYRYGRPRCAPRLAWKEAGWLGAPAK